MEQMTPTHFQQLELLHTVVKKLQGSLGNLPWPLQEDQQCALPGEQVTAQVQQRRLLVLNQLSLLHVYWLPQN